MRSDLLARLAAGPVFPLWVLTATHPDLPAPLALPVGELELTYDENTAPRVELRARGAIPTDLATLAALDPRTGVRIRVKAGYRWPEGDDLELVADLGLRDRNVTTPTVELLAQSDEALVTDNAPSNSGLTAASANAGIVAVLTSGLGSAPTIVNTAGAGPAVSIPSPQLGDKWAAIDDMADSIGDVDVYDDGLRTWYLEPRVTTAGTVVADFHSGPGGLIIGAPRSTLSRNGFANRVYLEYKWTDSGGVAQRVARTRSVTSGPFGVSTAPVRCYYEQRSVPATTTTADTAATSILKRMVGRGRGLDFDARAVPWLRPGHTITVTLPWGEYGRHIVSRVVLRGNGTMTVTTRYPDTSYSIGA